MDMCFCSMSSGATDLPHSNDGISDEDKEDDEGLDEGGDCLLALLEPGQHLKSERKNS